MPFSPVYGRFAHGLFSSSPLSGATFGGYLGSHVPPAAFSAGGGDFLLAPRLTHLCLRDATRLCEGSFDAIASAIGGLRDLCVHGCRGLTDGGLAALSGLSCPNLRWLNTVGAYKLSEGATQCLLSSHPALLLYSNPHHFASATHEPPDAALPRAGEGSSAEP